MATGFASREVVSKTLQDVYANFITLTGVNGMCNETKSVLAEKNPIMTSK